MTDHHSAIGSLRHRYAFKLIAGAAAMVTGLAVETLAPRALGPSDYGQYYYLLNFFSQILALICGGTSMAFTTRLARRPRDRGFVFVYIAWLLAVLAAIEFLAGVAWLLGLSTFLWPGTGMAYVYLGGVAAYLIFLGREATGMGDAYGLTIPVETVRVIQRVGALVLVVSVAAAGALDLATFFIYTCIVNAALVAASLYAIRRRGRMLGLYRSPRATQIGATISYLYSYSAPLLVYQIVAAGAAIFDRWLLQAAAGSTQQGFFSLGFQLSSLTSLFMIAIVPLLTREISIAHGRRNPKRIAELYQAFLPGLYFAAAFFCCFIAIHADIVAVLMGGRKFSGSATVLALMALTPIHQAYGYVSTSVYFATGQTRQFRNIGIVTQVSGLLLALLLVAPHAWMGLDLGAEGLALKVLLLQIAGHNAYVFFNCRSLGLNYARLVVLQVVTVAILVAFAAGSRLLSSQMPLPAIGIEAGLGRLAAAGVVYSLLSMAALIAVPGLAGLKRHQVTALFHRLHLQRLPGIGRRP